MIYKLGMTSLVTVAALASQPVLAQSAMDRYLQNKNIKALILENEETGEQCIVNKSKLDLDKILGIEICRADQIKEVEEIDHATKNPEVSGIFGSAVNLALGYYVLCSAVQSTPYLMQKYIEFNDDRSRGEKFKDIFLPSSDVQKNEARLKAVSEFAEDTNQTVCRPITNLNKKLIYLFSDNENN